MPREPRVGDAEILRAMLLHPDPVVTARELSDYLDYTADGVRRRLIHLEKKSMVKRRKVGAKAVVWWVSEKGRSKAWKPD